MLASSALKKKREESDPNWERIKSFVGAATPTAKHPLQQEADRLGMKKPLNMDEGGDPADEALRQSLGLGGFNPTSNTSAFGGRPPQVANIPPMPPPNVSQGTIQAGAPVTSPVQASPAPISTDYNQQASQIMGGVTPDSIQRLMQSLQQNANRGQVGAGIAGLGDAISSVGGIKGEHMNNAENLIQKNREMGMQLPGQMAEIGLKQHTVSEQLQARDPNSPYSAVWRKANEKTLAGLGWTPEQRAGVSAEEGENAIKNNLSFEESRAKNALAKATEENTQAYQQGMLGINRQNAGTAAASEQNRAKETQKDLLKETSSHWLQHPLNAREASGQLGDMANGAAQIPVVHSDQEFNSLPSGTQFKDENGNTHRKK